MLYSSCFLIHIKQAELGTDTASDNFCFSLKNVDLDRADMVPLEN